MLDAELEEIRKCAADIAMLAYETEKLCESARKKGGNLTFYGKMITAAQAMQGLAKDLAKLADDQEHYEIKNGSG